MKRISIIFFLILNIYAFSLEEIYVSLRVKDLKNDFYPLICNESKVYFNIKDLIVFLDLRGFSVKKDGYLSGEIDNKKIHSDTNFKDNVTFDDTVYINIDNLPKILPVESVSFNEEMYTLSIHPSFKLPYEVIRERLQKRRNLEFSKTIVEDNKKIYSSRRKRLDLGILSMDYNRPDFSSSEEIFNLGYASQLLYGDFSIDGQVFDEEKLNYVDLKYNNVDFLGGRDVTIGDIYLRSYSALNVESSLRGISVYGNESYARQESGKTIIDGNASGANTVELYQNGILIDYKNITNNSYKFEVNTISSDDEYKVVKYFPNGKTEEKTVYLLSDTQIFPKGEWDYILQGGQGIENHKDQYMYNVKYGVTSNLTLGIGNSFLTGDQGQSYDIIEGNFAYRTKALRFPSMIIGNYLYDTDEDEGTLFLAFTQKVGDYTFQINYDDYSTRLARDNSIDKRYELSFGRSYSAFEYKFRCSKEEYLDTEKEVGVDLYYRVDKYRFSSINKYECHEDEHNRYSNSLGVDYTGNKYLNINFNSTFDFYSDTVDDSYKLRLSRRGSQTTTNYFDLAGELEYDNSSHLKGTLEVTYYYDGLMRVNLPVTVTDDSTSSGISLQKSLALKDPLKLQYIKDKETFWIEGVVFKDINGNGISDTGEEGMKDVGITIDGIEVFTDSKGRYLVQNIPANTVHELSLIRASLDPTLEAGLEDMNILGRIGESMTFDIPLMPLSSIGGNILFDNNSSNDFILSRTIIDFLQDGIVKYSCSPEYDGFYIVDKILPGNYDVEITYLGRGKKIERSNQDQVIIPRSGDGDYYERDFKVVIIEDKEEG